MCFFCRHEATGATAAMGRAALDDLGGLEHLATVLSLARATAEPGPGQAEAAALLHGAARLRRECVGEAV
jgi:hypothetical protein